MVTQFACHVRAHLHLLHVSYSQAPEAQAHSVRSSVSQRGPHYERVILEMRDLAAHTLAYHEGISVDEAKESLDTANWTNDSAVRDFLSLDKHRAGKHEHKGFHDQVDHALAHIERTYQEV